MNRPAGKIAGLAAGIVAASFLRAAAEIHYVSPSGLHVAPYANWAEAATNIQAAIAASGSNDVVMVTNGAYVLDATVRVTNHVALVSWGGRDEVLLDGSALPAGQDAVFLQYGTLKRPGTSRLSEGVAVDPGRAFTLHGLGFTEQASVMRRGRINDKGLAGMHQFSQVFTFNQQQALFTALDESRQGKRRSILTHRQ